MHDDTPEVWIELAGKEKDGETSILIGQFYREMAEVRGHKP